MLPLKAFGLGARFTAAIIGGIVQIWIGKMFKTSRHMLRQLVKGIVVIMQGSRSIKGVVR